MWKDLNLQGLPIYLDKIFNEYVAIILSVTFVLFVGEVCSFKQSFDFLLRLCNDCVCVCLGYSSSYMLQVWTSSGS